MRKGHLDNCCPKHRQAKINCSLDSKKKLNKLLDDTVGGFLHHLAQKDEGVENRVKFSGSDFESTSHFWLAMKINQIFWH